jgi:hypothetical protein
MPNMLQSTRGSRNVASADEARQRQKLSEGNGQWGEGVEVSSALLLVQFMALLAALEACAVIEALRRAACRRITEAESGQGKPKYSTFQTRST